MEKFRATFWGIVGFILLILSAGSSLSFADSKSAAADPRPFERAQQRHWGLGPEAPWISIMLRHRSEINLTAEQAATLEQLRSDFGQQVTSKRADLSNAEREIERLLQENPVELAQVKAKIEEAEQLRAQFRYLRIETLEKGKAVLTVEQRDKLKNLAFSRHSRLRRPRGESS